MISLSSIPERLKRSATLLCVGLTASVILSGAYQLCVAADAVIALSENPAKLVSDWVALPAASWRPFRGKEDAPIPNMWTVETDGSIHHAPGGNNVWRGGDLVSRETYENFEWEVEWKVGKAANSGLFYRVDETGAHRIFDRCLEHQILDDLGYQNGKAPLTQRTGALYDIVPAASEKLLKTVGEWNITRIVVKGQKIEHWLNGALVMSADLDSPEYTAAYGKLQGGKGKTKDGRLGLQDHGGEVWYGKMRVRRIEVK